MSEPEQRGEGLLPDAFPTIRPAGAEGERHLGIIVGLFRAFIAFVTLMYAVLIGALCVHWIREGASSLLELALLPAVMLIFLNIVAWTARTPK